MKYLLFGNLDTDMRAVLKNIPYKVDYIVTNGKGQLEYEGKKVYTSVKLFEEKNNVYIFITDLANYAEYAIQLVTMGFVEGRDFAGANEYAYNQWENIEYFDDTFTVRVYHMAKLISNDSSSTLSGL